MVATYQPNTTSMAQHTPIELYKDDPWPTVLFIATGFWFVVAIVALGFNAYQFASSRHQSIPHGPDSRVTEKTPREWTWHTLRLVLDRSGRLYEDLHRDDPDGDSDHSELTSKLAACWDLEWLELRIFTTSQYGEQLTLYLKRTKGPSLTVKAAPKITYGNQKMYWIDMPVETYRPRCFVEDVSRRSPRYWRFIA